MDKLTRKELKSDKFALEVQHSVEYVSQHRQQMIRWGAIPAAAVVSDRHWHFLVSQLPARRAAGRSARRHANPKQHHRTFAIRLRGDVPNRGGPQNRRCQNLERFRRQVSGDRRGRHRRVLPRAPTRPTTATCRRPPSISRLRSIPAAAPMHRSPSWRWLKFMPHKAN